MSCRNIQEYVAEGVIDYLKERDGQIKDVEQLRKWEDAKTLLFDKLLISDFWLKTNKNK